MDWTEEHLMEIVKGDEEALRLCLAWRAHCHLIDDVEDCDNPENLLDTNVIGTEHAWFLETQMNPFWIRNKSALIPLVEISYNAWLDANAFESGAAEEQVAADVLKGWYHEFIFYVARLCGGWEHYRYITNKYREYDFDSLKKITLVDRDRLDPDLTTEVATRMGNPARPASDEPGDVTEESTPTKED